MPFQSAELERGLIQEKGDGCAMNSPVMKMEKSSRRGNTGHNLHNRKDEVDDSLTH